MLIITKINRPWPKSNQFWRSSGYISMTNSSPFHPCILRKMPRNCKFDLSTNGRTGGRTDRRTTFTPFNFVEAWGMKTTLHKDSEICITRKYFDIYVIYTHYIYNEALLFFQYKIWQGVICSPCHHQTIDLETSAFKPMCNPENIYLYPISFQQHGIA